MLTTNVVIETRRMQDGNFRGYAVEGPSFALGWWSVSKDRDAAYSAAAAGVRSQCPTRPVSFLHAET